LYSRRPKISSIFLTQIQKGINMTEKIYHADSYQKTFQAQVVKVSSTDHTVTLDRTAFYPGGGGQPFDTGSIFFNNHEVLVEKVRNKQGQITHYLEKDSPLPEPGDSVTGEINWDRRYALMRTHTAMHILCGVIFRDYGSSVTGGNMELFKGRMDFEFAGLKKELIAEIESSVNNEVKASRDVTWRTLPREEAFQIPDLIRTKINLLPPHIQEVRVVEIHGLDLQADGGTHVRSTSEVGPLEITDYKSKGKDNKRIYLSLVEDS
jgi:misacylated tRNA(Ala) deacylase